MPVPRSPLGALTLLAIVAAVAGCGPFGGDDEGSGEQEFTSSADAICVEARHRLAELQRDLPKTARQQARFTEDLLHVYRGELSHLQALVPPAEREAAFKRYLRARDRAIGYIEDGLGAAKAGNALAYADAQARVAKEQVERTNLAEQAGFTECSRPLRSSANDSQ